MIYVERRIYETVIYHTVLSVICAGLFYFNVLQPGYKLSVFMLSLCAVIDIVLLILFSSIYYRYTEEDMWTFYKTNLLAVISLTGPAVFFALIDSAVSIEPVYTFLFFPFKLGMIAVGMSKLCSALALSAILVFIAFIIPLFVKKVILIEEPLPPILEVELENDEPKKVSE